MSIFTCNGAEGNFRNHLETADKRLTQQGVGSLFTAFRGYKDWSLGHGLWGFLAAAAAAATDPARERAVNHCTRAASPMSFPMCLTLLSTDCEQPLGPLSSSNPSLSSAAL